MSEAAFPNSSRSKALPALAIDVLAQYNVWISENHYSHNATTDAPMLFRINIAIQYTQPDYPSIIRMYP